jgi:glycosyltransferase involved in cell wall biosynthesis
MLVGVLMAKDVSVIIPSFNRAHLLELIIPSYVQDCVLEIIVVDDGSTDSTVEVLNYLARKYSILKYIINDKNMKQMYSKNIGAAAAKGTYLYFGDDDSFVTEGALNLLRLFIENNKRCIVAARALYMKPDESSEQCLLSNCVIARNASDLVNPYTFEHHFYKISDAPIEVLSCQACIMIDKCSFLDIRFYEGFIGSCQREETDFMLRARAAGMKIYYYSSACQINLPRILASGGSWSSPIKREFSLFVNHSLFLFRNWSQIINDYGYLAPLAHFLAIYVMKLRNVCRKYLK